MDEGVRTFMEELKAAPETLGVAIFGSYARGDGRPDSDVDVFVLVPEGVRRDAVRRHDKAFEMVYASEKDAMAFYKENPDDCVQMWEDAIVMYDRDGGVERLKAYAAMLRQAGKRPPAADRLKHLRFDAEAKVSAIRYLSDDDRATAVMYLHQLAQHLLEIYFDRSGLWTPAPKQRLKLLRSAKPEAAELFDELYSLSSFEQQIGACEKILAHVFSDVPDARRK